MAPRVWKMEKKQETVEQEARSRLRRISVATGSDIVMGNADWPLRCTARGSQTVCGRSHHFLTRFREPGSLSRAHASLKFVGKPARTEVDLGNAARQTCAYRTKIHKCHTTRQIAMTGICEHSREDSRDHVASQGTLNAS